jgi:uncharacterized protein YjbI with pentapeptide repeats
MRGRQPVDRVAAQEDLVLADVPAGLPPNPDVPHPVLRAECEKCVGLCCVAPAFRASADFAIDKPAGRPCPNLQRDFRCGIHSRLRESGFGGCVAYDCFGAGQRVTQETFAGANWRGNPEVAPRMFAVFFVVRQLHELLWYLTEALALPAARPLRPRLQAAIAETDDLARGRSEALAGLDPAEHRLHVNELLREASALARAGSPGPGLDRRRADLAGADLRAVDLRGADLRGAMLIGADLRGANLALADLTGADLRGAKLDGADLRRALFLTQSQLESADGNRATGLPAKLTRPAHWA